jgi:phage gp36-like protein
MWRPLNEADLRTVLTAPEIDACRTAALNQGEPDPVPATLALVAQTVRGYIAGCSRNTLGPAGTLPEQLIGDAGVVARHRLLTRFPEVGLLSDARVNEYNQAMTALRDVAAGRIAVESPETKGPEKVPAGAGAVVVKGTRLNFTRDKTSRL